MKQLTIIDYTSIRIRNTHSVNCDKKQSIIIIVDGQSIMFNSIKSAISQSSDFCYSYKYDFHMKIRVNQQ